MRTPYHEAAADIGTVLAHTRPRSHRATSLALIAGLSATTQQACSLLLDFDREYPCSRGTMSPAACFEDSTLDTALPADAAAAVVDAGNDTTTPDLALQLVDGAQDADTGRPDAVILRDAAPIPDSAPPSVAVDAACLPAGAELCNGQDDDCDGQADENCPIGSPCSAGLGLCRREGAMLPDGNGGALCSAVPGLPSSERCDNQDNDCDGVIDNHVPHAGEECTAGERTGVLECNGNRGNLECRVE